jgi:hypothetical protein
LMLIHGDRSYAIRGEEIANTLKVAGCTARLPVH